MDEHPPLVGVRVCIGLCPRGCCADSDGGWMRLRRRGGGGGPPSGAWTHDGQGRALRQLVYCDGLFTSRQAFAKLLSDLPSPKLALSSVATSSGILAKALA